MELAVNIPEQLPQVGQLCCSIFRSSASSMWPATRLPTASKMVLKSALLPALYLVQEQQGYVSGSAMAHVAYANGVPFIAFRSLSDLAGGGEGANEMGTFFRIAADNSARVLLAFLAAWK